MDIFLLDSDYNQIYIIDVFERLIWKKRYYECGEFTMLCRGMDFEKVSRAVWLTVPGHNELGLVDGINYDGEYCTVKGMFAGVLLNRRVLYPTLLLEGDSGEILKREVQGRLNIPSAPDSLSEIGAPGASQVTGGTLLSFAQRLCTQLNVSFDIRLNPQKNGLEFLIWKGREDSKKKAVLSENFETLDFIKVFRSEREYKNYAVVAGQGRGADRVYTVVDIVPNGEERRELWVDARDLQQGEGTSLEGYIEILRRRGLDRLSEHSKAEDISVSSHQIDLLFGRDYELGDVIGVSAPSLDLNRNYRITGADLIYENGGRHVQLHLQQEEIY